MKRMCSLIEAHIDEEPIQHKRQRIEESDFSETQFADIPNDVIHSIFLFLPTVDLVSFATACTTIREQYLGCRKNSIEFLRLEYLNNGGTNQNILIPMLIEDNATTKTATGGTWSHQLTKTQFNQTFMDTVTNGEPMEQTLLSMFFGWNREPKNQPIQFVVAGGSLTKTLGKICEIQSEELDDQSKQHSNPYEKSDIDIFAIGGGIASGLQIQSALESILLQFGKLCSDQEFKYSVIKNKWTINIQFERANETKCTVQIILKNIDSVQNLLVFFDLDCVRFAYDGNQLYTTPEGIHALDLRLNLVSSSSLSKVRVRKYYDRGYKSIHAVGHPLRHLLNSNQLKAILERDGHNVKPPIPTNSPFKFIDETHEFMIYGSTLTFNRKEIETICKVGVVEFFKHEHNSEELLKKIQTHEYVFVLDIESLFVVERANRGEQLNYFEEKYFASRIPRDYCLERCTDCNKYFKLVGKNVPYAWTENQWKQYSSGISFCPNSDLQCRDCGIHNRFRKIVAFPICSLDLNDLVFRGPIRTRHGGNSTAIEFNRQRAPPDSNGKFNWQMGWIDCPVFSQYGFYKYTEDRNPKLSINISGELLWRITSLQDKIMDHFLENYCSYDYYTKEQMLKFQKFFPIIRSTKDMPDVFTCNVSVVEQECKIFWGEIDQKENGTTLKTTECTYDQVKDLKEFYCIPFICFEPMCVINGSIYPRVHCKQLIIIKK